MTDSTIVALAVLAEIVISSVLVIAIASFYARKSEEKYRAVRDELNAELARSRARLEQHNKESTNVELLSSQ